MNRFVLALPVIFLASCASTTSTAPIIADVNAIITDFNNAAAGVTLTSTQGSTLTTEITLLQTDLTAFSSGTTGTTVDSIMSDVTTAVSEIGTFLPLIETVLAVAGPQGATTTPPKVVIDYNKLKTDVAVSHKHADTIKDHFAAQRETIYQLMQAGLITPANVHQIDQNIDHVSADYAKLILGTH